MKPSQAKGLQTLSDTNEKEEGVRVSQSVKFKDSLSSGKPKIEQSMSTEWRELGFEGYDGGRRITTSPPDQVQKDYVDFKTLDKVRVICRFRPSNMREQREEKQHGLEQVDPEINGQALTVTRKEKAAARGRGGGKKTFYLDNTIDWKSSQNRCFRVIGYPMVQSVMAGYNATVFAYGQTGSGKTYTMFGPEGNVYSPQQIGIIQRAVSLLFKILQQRVKGSKNAHDALEGFKMKIQFVQIYKEQLFDLLNPVQGANLRIRYDPRTDAPYVENITQNVVHNTKEVLKLTKIAISNRVTDRTKMNAVSSRSHLVMSILVEQRKANGTKINSKLNFGDLAGSESIRKTGVKLGSKQFKELKSINLSLTQLTTVINDIVNGRRPAFRASKLTYLLQDSLGGNTKTTIVVCASPHIYNRDETIRTLTFAQNAKTIKNKAKINKEYTNSQLMKIIQSLESENERLKTTVAKLESKLKLGVLSGDISQNPEYKKLMEQISELENQMEVYKQKEFVEMNELKDQLRLKGLDLDDALLQVQKLQGEKQQEDIEKESMNVRIDELGQKLQVAKDQLSKMSTTNEQMKMTIENLQDQLQEKNQFIQLQKDLFADHRAKLELKEEELSYQMSKNQDMMGQIISLKKRLAEEQQARAKLETQVATISTELDEKQQVEKEKDALEREANELLQEKAKLEKRLGQADTQLEEAVNEKTQLARRLVEEKKELETQLGKADSELKRIVTEKTHLAQKLGKADTELMKAVNEKTQLKQKLGKAGTQLRKAETEKTNLKKKLGKAGSELRKREKDLRNADVKLKNVGDDLERARSEAKEAQEETIRLTAEEVLQKYNMDEEVLRGIECDLNNVLQAWKNRKKKRKQRIRPPNPNSTISLQVRNVIANFNIAMGQLKEYEKGQTEREVKYEKMQVKEQKLRDLRKDKKKLEKIIADLRKDNDELREEFERYKNSREFLNRGERLSRASDDKMLQYLDGVTVAALRGDDAELERLENDSYISEDEDETAECSMQDELEQQRVSIMKGGWRNRLKVGDKVDSLDSNDLWFTASIIDTKVDEQGDKVLVQYDGFDHKYDEWILRFDPKLARHKTKATGGKESGGTEAYHVQVLGKRSGRNFVKAGYLLKASKKDGKFKARYFVLFDNGILRLYANKHSHRELGAINMCHAKDVKMEEANHLSKVFEFSFQEAGYKFTLRSGSHEEMNVWIYALKNVKLKMNDASSRQWFEEEEKTVEELSQGNDNVEDDSKQGTDI